MQRLAVDLPGHQHLLIGNRYNFLIMITKDYNPSPIEVRFVEVLCDLKQEISEKLINFDVINIENNTQLDNPTIDFQLKDMDGDKHEVILKVIQKPDVTNED